MPTLAPPPTISVKTAAERLGVHENTIRNWIDRGILDGYRTPTGRRKVRLDAVERFAAEMFGVPATPLELPAETPAPEQVGRLQQADETLP